MSRLKLYLAFFGVIIVLKWSVLGTWLQSKAFLNIVLVVIGVLLGIVVIIAPKPKKRKQRDNSLDDEGV